MFYLPNEKKLIFCNIISNEKKLIFCNIIYELKPGMNPTLQETLLDINKKTAYIFHVNVHINTI